MNYYKKEWTDKDFNKVNKSLEKYFGGKWFLNHRKEEIYFPGNFYEIEKILGLPYTSTSICPMIGLDCNVNIYHPKFKSFHYSYVFMDENKTVTLGLFDDTENERFIKI